MKVLCARCGRSLAVVDLERNLVETSNKTRLGVTAQLERSPSGEARLRVECRCGNKPVVKLATLRDMRQGSVTI